MLIAQAVFYLERGYTDTWTPLITMGHKAMLRSVRPTVRLSVPFSHSVPFARWRCAHVAASGAFDRRQHGEVCPRSNAVSDMTN